MIMHFSHILQKKPISTYGHGFECLSTLCHSLLNPDYVKQLSYQEMKKAAQLEEDKRVTNIIQNDLLLEEKRQKRIREEREFQKKRLMAFMGPDSEEKN